MSTNLTEPQIMAGIEEDDRPDLSPPETPSPPSKGMPAAMRSNLVLGGLVLVAIAMVYALSLRGGPAIASANVKHAEEQVDMVILHLADATKPGAPTPGAMTRELIDGFYRHTSRAQTPLDRLSKNPFVFVAPRNLVAEAAPANPQVAANEKTPEQETLERAQAEFKKLYLQSVMMGHDGGSAIISNNLLTVGQQIKCFTVTSITPKSVTLKWQDHDFTLMMP